MFGIAIVLVVGVAVLEWVLPDSDLLGGGLDETCRRCDESAWRCGLCRDHYELATDCQYATGEWDQ
jgi:hypothetical protein